MAARSRKQADSSTTSPRAAAGLVGATVVLAAAFVGCYFAWRHWGSERIDHTRYGLSPEHVSLPAQPPWIRVDVKGEVFRDGSLEELSMLDPKLTKHIFHAFEMHPWVAKVNRISKQPPHDILVDLEYRRPIAWVEVPEGMFPHQGAGALPIDRHAVLLPQGDFAEEQLSDFIRISVDGLTMCGPNGTPWGDARVVGAAAIAAALGNNWRTLGLYRIRAVPDYSNLTESPRTRYELFTAGGKRLIWGRAPGEEVSGEPDASQKMQLLSTFVQRYGPLDEHDQTLGLDLRDVTSVLEPRVSRRLDQAAPN